MPVEAGRYVKTEWQRLNGLTISATSPDGYTPDGRPRLFDTSLPGDDTDLGSPNAACSPPGPGIGVHGEPGRVGENCVSQGNVLIIQSSNKAAWDDAPVGGTFTFSFDEPADVVKSVGVMGIRRGETVLISVTFADGTGDFVNFVGLGDNSVQEVALDFEAVVKFTVRLGGEGAISSVDLCVNDPTNPIIAPPLGFTTLFPSTSPSTSPEPTPLSSAAPSGTPTEVPSATPTEPPTRIPTLTVTPKPTDEVPSLTRLPTLPFPSNPSSSISPAATSSLPTSSPNNGLTCSFSNDFEVGRDGRTLSHGDMVPFEWFEELGLTISGFIPALETMVSPRIFDTGSVLSPRVDASGVVASEATWEANRQWGNRNLRSPNRHCLSGDDTLGWGTGGKPPEIGANCYPQGNGLILPSANFSIPDASYEASIMKFSFDPPLPFLVAMTILNVDSPFDFVSVGVVESDSSSEDDLEPTVVTFPLRNLGRNSVQSVKFEQENVEYIEVHMNGPRVITSLIMCPRTEPESRMLEDPQVQCPLIDADDFDVLESSTADVAIRSRSGLSRSIGGMLVDFNHTIHDQTTATLEEGSVFAVRCDDGFARLRVHGTPHSPDKSYSGKVCSTDVDIPCRSPDPEAIVSPLGVPTTQSDEDSPELPLDDRIVYLPIGSCNWNGTDDMIRIENSSESNVTFSVSPTWLGDATSGWMAVDFFGLDDDLQCSSYRLNHHWQPATHTASCIDGVAVVDVYGYGYAGPLEQTGNSSVMLPSACSFPPWFDSTKSCQFRFALQCSSSSVKRNRTWSTLLPWSSD